MLPVADGMLHGILYYHMLDDMLDYHVLLDDGGDAAFVDAQERGVAIGKLAVISNPDACVRLAKATIDVHTFALESGGRPTRAYGTALADFNDALAACIGKPE